MDPQTHEIKYIPQKLFMLSPRNSSWASSMSLCIRRLFAVVLVLFCSCVCFLYCCCCFLLYLLFACFIVVVVGVVVVIVVVVAVVVVAVVVVVVWGLFA